VLLGHLTRIFVETGAGVLRRACGWRGRPGREDRAATVVQRTSSDLRLDPRPER
jgi:hypothetical protein